jgi:hypothetical protein
MIKLCKIFYDTKINDKNNSSFCFIGGNMNFEFSQELKLEKVEEINIIINVLDDKYIKYLNDDLILIKINEEIVKFNQFKYENNKIIEEIKIKIIKKYGKESKSESTSESTKKTIDESNNKSKIESEIESELKFKNENESTLKIKTSTNIDYIQKISLFQGFYGQFSKIEISFGKEENKIEYKFLPISVRYDNIIFYTNKNLTNKDKNQNITIIPTIKIDNINLVNINYINYIDKKLDIIDYFGGIIQFLPFYEIFKNITEILSNIGNKKNIDENEKSNISNEIILNKYFDKEILNDFMNNIIKIILEIFFHSNDKEKLFQKNICFIYYMLFDLDIDLKISLKDIYLDTGIFCDFLELLINLCRNKKNKNEINKIIEDLNNNKYINLFKKPKKTLKQIYIKYMKDLFSFNSFWSKKKYFFQKDLIIQMLIMKLNINK